MRIVTTWHNFDSFNGWVLPSSGRQVSFDMEDCYVDENGDVWVPCDCGCGGATRAVPPEDG